MTYTPGSRGREIVWFLQARERGTTRGWWGHGSVTRGPHLGPLDYWLVSSDCGAMACAPGDDMLSPCLGKQIDGVSSSTSWKAQVGPSKKRKPLYRTLFCSEEDVGSNVAWDTDEGWS